MEKSREELLKEVMEADFTVVDLNLYLDTHPNDFRAVAMFNNAVQTAMVVRNTYERKYGPLTVYNSFSGYPWKWIESPWPWERQ